MPEPKRKPTVNERYSYLSKRVSLVTVGWNPPLYGWIKLNTDGSAYGNPGPAGAGGVLRNAFGGCVKGFQRKLGVSNSLVAELWAIRDDLILAKDLNIDSIDVESDAKEVVKLIVDDEHDDRPLMPLIDDCKMLLKSFRRFRIRHNYREANKVADQLAKGAVVMGNTFIVLEEPPRYL